MCYIGIFHNLILLHEIFFCFSFLSLGNKTCLAASLRDRAASVPLLTRVLNIIEERKRAHLAKLTIMTWVGKNLPPPKKAH